MKETVVIAYSEIALKSRRTRRELEDLLIKSIRYMLIRGGIEKVKISRERGRIFVKSEDIEKSARIIAKIFGIAFTMPSIEVEPTLENIVETGIELAKEVIGDNETFAVRARRAGLHPFLSKDIEEKLGEAILKELREKGVKVNLRNPDKTIYVEVREKRAYISDCILKGHGGLPINSQGKVIALISGGVDSAVAAWLMMKRGSLPILLYFDNSPYWTETHHRRVLTVAKFLRELVPVADYRLFIVPHGKILTEFIDQGPRKLTCILCKRSMYRIACRLAEQMNADAIVTGESLGQVASQTLANLVVLNEASSLPIFRPLIGMNKDEIVELAGKIGIREIAATKVPKCTAVPRKPTTKAKIELVKAIEKRMSIERLVEEAIRDRKEILL